MREEQPFEIEIITPEELKQSGQRWALLTGVFEGPSVLPQVAERVSPLLPVSLDSLIESGGISGIFKEYTLLHVPEGRPFKRVILLGLGSPEHISLDSLRSIAARAARTLRKIRCPEMVVYPADFPGISPEDTARALVEGVVLGTFRAHVYRHEALPRPEFERLVVVLENEENFERVAQAVREAGAIARATNAAKDLVNEPADRMTPKKLAEYAMEVGDRFGFSVEVFDEKRLQDEHFGGILAVGQGSVNPPRLIIMRYGHKNGDVPRIALVGKGITFDAGGISLKSADHMHEMKYDKAGAAAVINAMRAAAVMKLPIELIGLVPAAENMPSGTAYRPGDVISMWNGTQVEVLNTDAEGRMLLADALAYVASMNPDLIIDIATLTGGCVVALGHITTGLMCNNERLARDLETAGENVLERVWRLPLFREYSIQLKSIVADLVNSGGREGSAVTAGIFLRHFIDRRPWAHLDIAGTAWIEESTVEYFHRPYQPKRGATGIGVRLLAEFLRKMVHETHGSRKMLQERLAHDDSLIDDPVGTLRMPQGGW